MPIKNTTAAKIMAARVFPTALKLLRLLPTNGDYQLTNNVVSEIDVEILLKKSILT